MLVFQEGIKTILEGKQQNYGRKIKQVSQNLNITDELFDLFQPMLKKCLIPFKFEKKLPTIKSIIGRISELREFIVIEEDSNADSISGEQSNNMKSGSDDSKTS